MDFHLLVNWFVVNDAGLILILSGKSKTALSLPKNIKLHGKKTFNIDNQ